MTTKSKRTRFDYAAAWRDLIGPVLKDLHPGALEIYRALRDHPAFEELAQGTDLDCPMPSILRQDFDAIPSDDLAYAARVLYYCGHWASGGRRLDAGTEDTRGATWKFSNLADQVLRARLGLETRAHRHGNGWHFEVHEGMLRLCASSPDSWTWIELGPADVEFAQRALLWKTTLPVYSRASNEAREQWEQAAWAATRKVPTILREALPPRWAPLLDTCEHYMVEEGKGSDDCPECGHAQWFTKSINHTRECIHYPLVPVLAREIVEKLDTLRRECLRRDVRIDYAEVAKVHVEWYVTPAAYVAGEHGATPRTCHDALPGDGFGGPDPYPYGNGGAP